MSKNLIIVESPTKVKTIEGFLGKDYKVVSSMGHVRDLAKGDSAIDVADGFKPTYIISPDKKEVIKTLKKLAEDAETVFLASDEDREGEAISWHLKEVLDLTDKKTRRIVFTEITKNAIVNALKNPRGIDLDLVNAQQARRVLDRLVGFELSPILWKKIKTGLSAGRVQSVAVRLVVEREREIDKFKTQSTFKCIATFDLGNKVKLVAELSEKFKDEAQAVAFLEGCKNADFTISDVQTKPAKKTPAPPFTTSTLQQEASRKLNFSVSQTMLVAQKLYEAGKISYMRTDSVNLSEEAMGKAANEITSSFGKKYLFHRQYKTKSSGAQEAHEAIRPTDFSVTEVDMERNAQRLYELIWKRAIASQMADAELERMTATISISNQKAYFQAVGETLLFDGFLKVYRESNDEEEDELSSALPPLKVNQKLSMETISATETYSRPPARYTEASLVKNLEELGIGRPSTYAPTISTVQKRGYVVKENREGKERNLTVVTLQQKEVKKSIKTEITGTEKNKLFPTNMAMIVNDFLVEYFPDITNYSFTAEIEQEFDEIASGKLKWQKMLDKFYKPFHKVVEKTEQIERSAVQNKSRLLGHDPKTNLPIYAKLGRYGAYVQIGENAEDDSDKKPRFSSLRPGQFLENITLEDALELFKMPRQLGDFEGDGVQVNIGRFGPYVLHQKKFVSIPKTDDPYTITLERATELIEAKRVADANKFIKAFDEDETVQVLLGRFGPYIKAGKKNVKIPKGKEPKELTWAEVKKLVDEAPEKKGRFVRRKKAE